MKLPKLKKVDLRLCRLEHEEVLEKMEIELLRSDLKINKSTEGAREELT